MSVASQDNQVSGTWATHECQQWLRVLHKVRGTRCLPSSLQLRSILLRFSCCCPFNEVAGCIILFWSSGKSLVLLVSSKILCLRGNAWKFIVHPTNIKTMYICCFLETKAHFVTNSLYPIPIGLFFPVIDKMA